MLMVNHRRLYLKTHLHQDLIPYQHDPISCMQSSASQVHIEQVAHAATHAGTPLCLTFSSMHVTVHAALDAGWAN
jgi:hypothetical protein